MGGKDPNAAIFMPLQLREAGGVRKLGSRGEAVFVDESADAVAALDVGR